MNVDEAIVLLREIQRNGGGWMNLELALEDRTLVEVVSISWEDDHCVAFPGQEVVVSS